MAETKPAVIIAIDILLRGRSCRKHGIASIGICVGADPRESKDPKVLFYGCYHLKTLDNQHQSKHKVVPLDILEKARDSRSQMQSFRKLIDMWAEEHTVYFVCRDAGKTVGCVDRYLEFDDLLALRFAANKKDTRSILDIGSFIQGVGILITDVKLPETVFPDQWAKYIYKLYFSAFKAKSECD